MTAVFACRIPFSGVDDGRIGGAANAVEGQSRKRPTLLTSLDSAPGRRPMGTILPAHRPLVTTPRRDSTSVYRYYDAAGVLVYVGITRRGIRRNDEHTEKEWWPHVTRQEVEHYDTRHAASQREKRLIHQYRPPFNKQHNPDAEALRETYLTLRAAGPAVEPAIAAYQRIKRQLPLVLMDDRTFRTCPEDAAVAALLVKPLTGHVPVISNRGKLGAAQIEMQSIYALIHLMSKRVLYPDEIARAYIMTKCLGNGVKGGVMPLRVVVEYPKRDRPPYDGPTHPFPGANRKRQDAGLPGHCERCVRDGHLVGHRKLSCRDVGCTAPHDGAR